MAIEAGWGATGDIQESFTGFNPAFGNITLDLKGDYEITTVRVLGILPLEAFSLYGGVGSYSSDLTASARISDGFQIITVSADDSDSGATVIGGIQFELDRVTIRGEYEWFDTDSDVEAWIISIGLLLRF